MKKRNQKVFLILGNSGVGKSSFAQKLTSQVSSDIGHNTDSNTFKCYKFKNNKENVFIDSPGLNHTKKDRSEILLLIARYLHQNGYGHKNIFIIYLQNKQIKISIKAIQEFSYTYFLYERFKEQISSQEVKQFIKEFYYSKYLLNWHECNFHQKEDQYSEKRTEIFSHKDLALNYFQIFNNYHIVVKTFFDMTADPDLGEVDTNVVDLIKEQIWSNNTKNLDKFDGYKQYIENQEQNLFQKIKQIIEYEDKILNLKEDQQIQNILLIGNSSVGKSSLIEQLTKLKGIRGQGIQSETLNCQFYSIVLENIVYRFIDTPGIDGTLENQDSFHSLKIIADFLRRNNIIEFKILIMRSEIDDRDEIQDILVKFIVFLEEMCFQDITFVDSDNLKHILQMNHSNYKEKLYLIKDKILIINLMQHQTKEYNDEEIYMNELKILNIKFQNNYFTKKGKLIEVNKDVDKKQQNTLFKAINQIQSISIDEKINSKLIKNINQIKIIENVSQYKTAYIYIQERYKQLYFLQANVLQFEKQENNQQQEFKQLSDKRYQFFQELASSLFLLIGELNLTQEIKTFIQKQNLELQNILKIYNIDKLQNDIQRHFIATKFTPILFENETISKNIFSRKQQYFWQYSHQLREFIKQGNQNHQQILEDIAKIKILKDITYLQFIQSNYIDTLYGRNTEEVIYWIEVFFSRINSIIGTGIQIYKYATYFNSIVQAVVKNAQKKNIYKTQNTNMMDTLVKPDLEVMSKGIDIYNLGKFRKKQICRYQMNFSSSFHNLFFINKQNHLTFTAALGLSLITPTSLVIAGILFGVIQTSLLASSQTFDLTISVFLKSIIDDILPNQALLYFQRSELLKKIFNLDNYNQLQQQQGYKIFRQLEERNYYKEEQKEILFELFKNPKKTSLLDLLDLISQHIVQSYFCDELKVKFQQSEQQSTLDYLEKISEYLNHNKQLINTFYNNCKNEELRKSLIKVEESYQESNKQVKDKLKYFKYQENNCNAKIIWDEKQNKIIKQYEQDIVQFIFNLKKIKCTYQEQIEFTNGFLRKGDCFPKLLNSYCNLMQLKVEYLYQQPFLISDLSKMADKKCFYLVNPGKSFSNFFKLENQQKTTDLLFLLSECEKYIPNRYLQKIIGQKESNFTCLAKNEILNCELEYSIDLHDIAIESKNLYDFIHKIKSSTKDFQIKGDNLQRLKEFYQSFHFLQNHFNFSSEGEKQKNIEIII